MKNVFENRHSRFVNHDNYIKLRSFFDERPECLKALHIASKVTDIIGYSAYAVLIAYLLLCRDERLLRCLVVPALTFVLATVIRKKINAVRPYESEGISPFVNKNTKGKSFPSRHTVCITAITASWMYVYMPVGIFMAFVTLVIMVIRPLSFIHYPSDIIAGAVFSSILAVVGYILI